MHTVLVGKLINAEQTTAKTNASYLMLFYAFLYGIEWLKSTASNVAEKAEQNWLPQLTATKS